MPQAPQSKPGSAAAPVSDLVRQAREQELAARIHETEARCAVLRADLAEARIRAEPIHRLRMMAEDAWEAAGDIHSVADAERLGSV